MQGTNAVVNGTSLQQSSGGLQNGQGGLQQQSDQSGTTQSGTTSQPQQDVLGSDAFSKFEGLKVQGVQQQSTPPATSSNRTVGLYFGIVLLLLIAAYLVFQRYHSTTAHTINETVVPIDDVPQHQSSLTDTEPAVSPKPVKKTTKKKQTKPKVVKKKKPAAKKKK